MGARPLGFAGPVVLPVLVLKAPALGLGERWLGWEEKMTMLTPTFFPSTSSGLPGVALQTKCSQCHLPFFFLVN